MEKAYIVCASLGFGYVILIPDVFQGTFEKQVDSIMFRLSENDIPIASVGYSYGTKDDIDKLVDDAEDMMYEEKAKIHALHPEFDRNYDL